MPTALKRSLTRAGPGHRDMQRPSTRPKKPQSTDQIASMSPPMPVSRSTVRGFGARNKAEVSNQPPIWCRAPRAGVTAPFASVLVAVGSGRGRTARAPFPRGCSPGARSAERGGRSGSWSASGGRPWSSPAHHGRPGRGAGRKRCRCWRVFASTRRAVARARTRSRIAPAPTALRGCTPPRMGAGSISERPHLGNVGLVAPIWLQPEAPV